MKLAMENLEILIEMHENDYIIDEEANKFMYKDDEDN